MNTAINLIEEIIKEVEQYDNGGDNLKKAIQEGMTSGLKLAHKRISSLPFLDIDSLQRYDTAKPTDFIDTVPIIYKSDNGEYVRYDDLLELLK